MAHNEPTATWHLVAREDIPALNIRAGDLIRFDASRPDRPWTVARAEAFDYGAVLVALNEGHLDPIDISPCAAVEQLRPAAAAPFDPPPASRPALRVIR